MNPKILLAEDEPSTRLYMSEVLEHRGYAVSAVADGAQAIAAFDQEDFDLVVTDMMMPHCSGLDLLSHVRGVT